MKKYILLILAPFILVTISMLFDIRFVLQGPEQDLRAMHRSDMDKTNLDTKEKEILISKYQREAENRHRDVPQQTTLYNKIECLLLITPDLSLLLHINDIRKNRSWGEVQELGSQIVEMTYISYTYSYQYRILNKNTNKEIIGEGAFTLNSKETSGQIINISGVKLEVSLRSLRSIFVQHPAVWDSTVIDADEYLTMPLNIEIQSSNKALQPTHLRGTFFVPNSTKIRTATAVG